MLNNYSIQNNIIPVGKQKGLSDYLQLAKQVDDLVNLNYDRVWEEEIDVDASQRLFGLLTKSYHNADPFYKNRYLYQISKLAIYSKLKEATKFFINNFDDTHLNYAVDFYLKDHKAYFLKATALTAVSKTYIQNFTRLPEHTLSEFISYKFTRKNVDSLTLFNDLSLPIDKQTALFFNNFIHKQSSVLLLEKVANLDINSEITHLVLSASLQEELQKHYPKNPFAFNYINCKEMVNYPKDSGSYYWFTEEMQTSRLPQLKKTITSILDQKPQDINRYLLALAQVEFMLHDYQSSIKTLDKVMNNSRTEIKKQAVLLKAMITVNEMNYIGPKEENELFKIFKVIQKISQHESKKADEEDFYVGFAYDSVEQFWQIVASKYLQQGDNFKAYLAIHDVDFLNYYRDQCLIEDLLNFVQKKAFTAYESELLSHLAKQNPELYLYDYLASTYVYEFDFTNALYWYDRLENEASSAQLKAIPKYTDIPKSIIASTYRQCYECPFESNMTKIQANNIDTVNVFATKKELLKEAQRLRKSPAIKDQIAYGNLLLNINRKGYYRDLYSYDHSGGTNARIVKDINDGMFKHILPINFKDIMEVFHFVLTSKVSSEEKKSMAAWGIVQAQQGILEDIDNPFYEAIEFQFYSWKEEQLKEYYVNNPELRKQYHLLNQFSDSAFTKEILKECGFFNYYAKKPID